MIVSGNAPGNHSELTEHSLPLFGLTRNIVPAYTTGKFKFYAAMHFVL